MKLPAIPIERSVVLAGKRSLVLLSPEELSAREYARKEMEQFERRLYDLVLEYEPFSHYSDPEFLEGYARKHSSYFSHINSRAHILEQYRALHTPRAFAEFLKRRAPETYERALWRVRAMAIADRLSVDPSTAATAPWLSERAQNADEEIAFTELKLRKVKELREKLQAHDDLDPDEREAIVRRFEDAFDDRKDDSDDVC